MLEAKRSSGGVIGVGHETPPPAWFSAAVGGGHAPHRTTLCTVCCSKRRNTQQAARCYWRLPMCTQPDRLWSSVRDASTQPTRSNCANREIAAPASPDPLRRRHHLCPFDDSLASVGP